MIRDASFAALRREIVHHLAACSDNPRPCRWTARDEDILAKIERARERLPQVHKPND